MTHACAAAPALIALSLADPTATADQSVQINTLLASMTCQSDPDNSEAEDAGGFDLDNVICADGQHDIKLNAAYAVLEQRKE